MTSVRFQGKPFSIMVIQVYAPTSNAEEAEVERFYEDLQDFLELTPPRQRENITSKFVGCRKKQCLERNYVFEFIL